jgi:hypothetical protein
MHLDIRNLEFQSSFKITMILNAQAAMSLSMIKNPIFWLWHKLSNRTLISTQLFKFMKSIEVARALVMGSVEDERKFNSLMFLKSKLRNRFTPYLDLVWGLGSRHVCTQLLHLQHIPLSSSHNNLESSKSML